MVIRRRDCRGVGPTAPGSRHRELWGFRALKCGRIRSNSFHTTYQDMCVTSVCDACHSRTFTIICTLCCVERDVVTGL